MKLAELADQLDAAPRLGADADSPEGSRFIQMSDTLARRIAHAIRDTSEVHTVRDTLYASADE